MKYKTFNDWIEYINKYVNNKKYEKNRDKQTKKNKKIH